MATSFNRLDQNSLDSMGRTYWHRTRYEGHSHHSTCDYIEDLGYTEAQVCRIVRWAQIQSPSWEQEERATPRRAS